MINEKFGVMTNEQKEECHIISNCYFRDEIDGTETEMHYHYYYIDGSIICNVEYFFADGTECDSQFGIPNDQLEQMVKYDSDIKLKNKLEKS